MGIINVDLSNELHRQVKKLAGPRRVNRWVREAIAEKAGRSQLSDEIAELRQRVDELERRLAARP